MAIVDSSNSDPVSLLNASSCTFMYLFLLILFLRKILPNAVGNEENNKPQELKTQKEHGFSGWFLPYMFLYKEWVLEETERNKNP